eukprot:13459475-Heterocapsa_arctica.AAC.1
MCRCGMGLSKYMPGEWKCLERGYCNHKYRKYCAGRGETCNNRLTASTRSDMAPPTWESSS